MAGVTRRNGNSDGISEEEEMEWRLASAPTMVPVTSVGGPYCPGWYHISWAATVVTSEGVQGTMHEDGDNIGLDSRGWAIGMES